MADAPDLDALEARAHAALTSGDPHKLADCLTAAVAAADLLAAQHAVALALAEAWRTDCHCTPCRTLDGAADWIRRALGVEDGAA